MKKTLIALATLAVLSSSAYAQSNVTMYGVLDEAVRFSNHVDASNHSQVQLVDGIQQGSRLGFKGYEDLGNGTKAIFALEAGFSVGTGNSLQGGRLFGRNATVGLSNSNWGTLTVGRQNTLAYDFDIATDVYGVTNNGAISGYQSGLTGLRFDNSVKYVNDFSGVSVGAEYSFGNQLGDQKKNAAYALATGYNNGPFDVRAVYQRANDTQNGIPGTLPGQNQKLYAVGSSYDFGETKLFGQYFNDSFDVSAQRNKIYVVGVSHKFSPVVVAKAAYAFDKQENFNDGNRKTVSGLVSYALTPRTDIYSEIDYNRVSNNYSNAFYNLNNATNPNTSSTGLAIGLRHKF